MKVNIITRHTPSNYGSLLQAIATLKLMNSFGFEAQIIDYLRKDDFGLAKVRIEAKKKYSNPLKRLLYIIVRYPLEKYAELRFRYMRKRYLDMTQSISDKNRLKDLNADVFITGSDQVWGPMISAPYDGAFFLDFVDKGKPKLSIAASFGRTQFDDTTRCELGHLLSEYRKITVREDSAVKLVSSISKCKNVEQVLDPTLLLNKEQWLDLLGIDYNDSAKISKPYILIYQIHNDPKLSLYASNLAKRLNYRLLRVSSNLHQIFRNGHFVSCPNLKDFISSILGAQIIVTDSFHGTCFSINLNKPFIEILPNNATGTRNQSILNLTGLTDRIVKNFDDYSLANTLIDYEMVNKIMANERTRSIEIIKSMFDF